MLKLGWESQVPLFGHVPRKIDQFDFEEAEVGTKTVLLISLGFTFPFSLEEVLWDLCAFGHHFSRLCHNA